jgi:hypothetical protein
MFLNISVVCFVVCFGSTDALPVAPPISDFCTRYERQVLTREDVTALKTLPRRLRDRVQGNDLDYACQCLHWKSRRCAPEQGE